jgi:2-oxo-3-hexenedioate decarboxylase
MPTPLDAAALAGALDTAWRLASPIAQHGALDFGQAQDVQARWALLREQRGETRVGMKLAFTNPAMMARRQVLRPVRGVLLSGMQIGNGDALDLYRCIAPRMEAEIAFVLARPLAGDASLAQAWDAVAGIAPAIEIADSRYSNFQFSIHDLMADDAAGGRFVLGPGSRPEADLGELELVLSVNEVEIARGPGTAILGHPLQALLMAAQLADEAGEPLQAGDIIMAGSATDPVPVKPGDRIKVSIDGLGVVQCHC